MTLRATNELGGDIAEEPLFDYAVAPHEWNARGERVKQSFLYAYHAYEKAAFGADELSPVSNGSVHKCV